MGIMRKTLLSELRKIYPNVKETYGYITKNTRITHNLPKEHYVDARCISGSPDAKPLGYYFYQKKVRCHNRQIHKANLLKGGLKRNKQADYLVKGFRLFDKVKYNNKEYFIFGRRQKSSFSIKDLLGQKPNKSGSAIPQRIKFLETKHNILTERETRYEGRKE